MPPRGPTDLRLSRLFLDLLSSDELRAWIRQYFPLDIATSLPGAIASPRAVAEEAAGLLVRHGLLADVWTRLLQTLPRRAADIQAARDEIEGGSAAPAALRPPMVAIRCRRCGIAARSDGACLGLAPAHDFVELVGEVFCADCGVGPVQPIAACTGARAVHRFITAPTLPRCRRCGRAAGERTQCGGLAPGHEFMVPGSA